MQLHKGETKTATVHSLEKPIKKSNINICSPFTYYGEVSIMEEEVI